MLSVGENLYFDPQTGTVVTTDANIRDKILEAGDSGVNGHKDRPMTLHLGKSVLRKSNDATDAANEMSGAVVICSLLGVDKEQQVLPRWKDDYWTKITGLGGKVGILRKGDFTSSRIAEEAIIAMRIKKTGKEAVDDVKAIQISYYPALYGSLPNDESALLNNLFIGRFQADPGNATQHIVWIGDRYDFLPTANKLPEASVIIRSQGDNIPMAVDVYADNE